MNAASNRKPLVFAIVAFLLGVGGTVFGMNLLRPNLPPNVGAEAAAPKDNPVAEPKDAPTGEKPAEQNVAKLTLEAEKTAGLTLEAVALRDLHEGLTVPAIVEAAADRVAKITPPVAGKIVRVLVKPGDAVRAGQPLAVIDSYEVAQAHAAENQAAANIRQAESALQTARAESAQARTRLANAQKALTTQRDLAKAGAFAQAPLVAARTEIADAQSELLSAQKEAQSHRIQLQRTERLFKEGIVSRSELEQAQLEHQQDELKVTRASGRVDAAKATLAREERLAQGGLLNRQAVQTTEAEVRAAESDIAHAVRQEQAAQTGLAGAKQALAAATANLGALEGANGHIAEGGGGVNILSPISGVVSAQSATLGETVERSATLFQIADLSSVIVEANVPEASVARVRVGASVEALVAAYPGKRFPGVVQSVGGSVSEKTRTLPVLCLVQNPGLRLKPEMFARVILTTGERSGKALMVSEEAIDEDGEKRFLFVKTGDGVYEKREVTTGRSHDKRVEILAGVKPGEKVVSEGMFILKSESKKDELKGDE